MKDTTENRSHTVQTKHTAHAVVTTLALGIAQAHAMPITDVDVTTFGTEARFSMLFQSPPNFFTDSETGLPKDEFYFYINQAAPIDQNNYDPSTIWIRSGSIRRDKEVVEVRESMGDTRLLDEEKFLFNNNLFLFSVPIDVLMSFDGRFYWQLLTMNYGVQDAELLNGRANVWHAPVKVPEPSVLTLLLSGLLSLFVLKRRVKHESQ